MSLTSPCPTALAISRLAALLWAFIVFLGPEQASAQGFETIPSDHCAKLGEGFVAVAGSDACVRIGGHVRVEFGNGGALPGGVYSNSVRDGVRPASEHSHVRAGAGSGSTDLFPR